MEVETRVIPLNNTERPDSGSLPDKRKRKKSVVWEHFTVETVGAGCTRACCKQCKKSFSYITDSKLSGTSHLKRHISLGVCQVNKQENQQSSYPKTSGPQVIANLPKKRPRATPGFAGNGVSFDQERCDHDIAKMVISHDYPLNIMEHRGFINFVQTLQPKFNPLCLNSVEGDCVSMYLRGKQNLFDIINGIPGKVNLTLDSWTSNHGLTYAIVRGHFIDGDWNLHHPILNVVTLPFPESDYSLNQTIAFCLSDWHLEGRLLTVAVDKSFSSEIAVENLRGFLSIKNPVSLNGQLLNRNCYARVLSRLAVDALRTMTETISKVRDSLKFVKFSDSHEEKFIELKQQLQVPSALNLLLDDHYKWDTTYHMLVAAWELKEVFACFDTICPEFTMALTTDDWKQVETLCTYLKYLYDAAHILTAKPYPTANLFFAEVSKLQMELHHATFSVDPFLSSLILPLYKNFDQYWRESCLILAVAVAMDPRHKMKLVEQTFAKIFCENAQPWIRLVEDGLHELFFEYNTERLHLTATNGDVMDQIMFKTEQCEGATNGDVMDQIMFKTEQCEGATNGDVMEDIMLGDNSLFVDEDGLSDYDFNMSDFTGMEQFKSEMDEYLEEPLLSEENEFDILSWWRVDGLKYPTLSRMAGDILSMTISTVSTDSVFDTDIRKMDNYRSSLGPLTLEALICAKDWLK